MPFWLKLFLVPCVFCSRSVRLYKLVTLPIGFVPVTVDLARRLDRIENFPKGVLVLFQLVTAKIA